MEKILWHRRESRRRTEKTNVFLQPWEAPAYSKMDKRIKVERSVKREIEIEEIEIKR